MTPTAGSSSVVATPQATPSSSIAGVMAAKRTHELIPFCHPLGLEKCDVAIDMNAQDEAVVRCTVSVHHKTGVEEPKVREVLARLEKSRLIAPLPDGLHVPDLQKVAETSR